MPNTPKKPEDKNEFSRLRTKKHLRADERHAEMLAVQEKIVQATKAISLATKWYAFAAMAMLLWSVIAFFLVQIYF